MRGRGRGQKKSVFVHAQGIKNCPCRPLQGGEGKKGVKFCPRSCWMTPNRKVKYILLILRSHGRHHVIKVHDYVNERVEKAKEWRMATGEIPGSRPHRHRHDTMVNDMKQWHLIELFSSNEAKLKWKREKKINHLGFLTRDMIKTVLSHRVYKLWELAEVVHMASM